MRGTSGVVDARATHGTGGVKGAAWGTTEVVGATRGATEVDKAHDEVVTKGQVVRPPGVAVGPPATVGPGGGGGTVGPLVPAVALLASEWRAFGLPAPRRNRNPGGGGLRVPVAVRA
jgi:hypothetical protein